MGDKLKRYIEKMADIIDDYVQEYGYGTCLKKGEIEGYLQEKGLDPNSGILTSDHCYNRANKGLDHSFQEYVHLYEYLGRNKYRILGSHYLYTGEIMHKPSGELEERVVGEWLNGKIIRFNLNSKFKKSEYNKQL